MDEGPGEAQKANASTPHVFWQLTDRIVSQMRRWSAAFGLVADGQGAFHHRGVERVGAEEYVFIALLQRIGV